MSRLLSRCPRDRSAAACSDPSPQALSILHCYALAGLSRIYCAWKYKCARCVTEVDGLWDGQTTVREALEFSASLRLASDVSREERKVARPSLAGEPMCQGLMELLEGSCHPVSFTPAPRGATTFLEAYNVGLVRACASECVCAGARTSVNVCVRICKGECVACTHVLSAACVRMWSFFKYCRMLSHASRPCQPSEQGTTHSRAFVSHTT